MRLASWNVNGIRAVERKGSLNDFLHKTDPDIFFFQETKAQSNQLSKSLTESTDYHQIYHSAEKKGYSGVSAWIKKDLALFEKAFTGMPDWEDIEGRVIRVDMGKLSVLGIYFPNGGKSHEAWLGKLKFYDHFHHYINQLRSLKRDIIWCGDLNVAHNEIDLARPEENKKSIGFLPEERSWVDRLVSDNWVDVFRTLHPNTKSYTWWNLQTRARERNVGWRIDYFLIDQPLLKNVTSIKHDNDQMGSDHCPIIMDINLS